MPQVEWFVAVGMGGLFTILGITLFVKGRSAEKSYYDSYSTATDVRRYLEREPQPGFESLKVGGLVSIAIGLLIVAIGTAFYF